jgi:two-component sensor histidine kinase
MKLALMSKAEWRTLLIRSAVINACLLLLGVVVAAEFYFTASTGPMRVSWLDAATLGVRNWLPWLVLSPITAGLAGLFPLERKNWPKSLLAHLAGCVVAALLYEGVLTILFPGPFPGLFRQPPAPRNAEPPSGASRHATDSPAGAATDMRESGPGTRDRSLPVPARYASPPLPPGSAAPVQTASGGANASGPPLPPADMPRPGLFQRAAFRSQFVIPIYWCIVCVWWALDRLRDSRERERRALELEARLAEANLRVLKMQLQPHFLFNALHAIASLIHENPKAADDMLGALSQFLRMNLEAAAENEVPLKRELEFVDSYLEIQQARFGDRLRIQRDVEPAAKEAMVPPFILQPLVENSIRHGIENREAGGIVTLRARRQSGLLHLEVSDDGGGLANGQLLNFSEGVGLSNTKARLQALYGERHRFSLTQNHPTGVCVRIELPFRACHPAPREGV